VPDDEGPVGYYDCSVPDCFELYVGRPGERCLECDDNNCETHCECERCEEENAD
jgi:hypothetical protein